MHSAGLGAPPTTSASGASEAPAGPALGLDGTAPLLGPGAAALRRRLAAAEAGRGSQGWLGLKGLERAPGGTPALRGDAQQCAAVGHALPERMVLATATANSWASGQALLEWCCDKKMTVDVVGLQVHRVKHRAKVRSSSSWSRRAGHELFGAPALGTGPGPLDSSGGAAVLTSLAAVSEERPKECSALSPCRAQAAELNAGLGIPIFVIPAYIVDSIGAAGDNIVLLEALQTWVGSLAWPRVILADWDIEPEDLSWARLATGVLVGPWSPTCGKREYDFAIVSEALASRVGALNALSIAPLSPHSPATIELNGPAQMCHGHQSGVPQPLPAGSAAAWQGRAA